MEIHVIRHSPVKFNKNRCYGSLDVPLANTFENDVKKINKLLDNDYNIIYCSPKNRCFKLANALELKNILTDQRLSELDFGDWEGKLWSDINKKDLKSWMEDFVKIPAGNGESLNQMFIRVSGFIEDLRNEKFDKVLIITHSGVIRCIWGYLLEIPLKNIFKIPVGYFECFTFNLGEKRELDSIINLK